MKVIKLIVSFFFKFLDMGFMRDLVIKRMNDLWVTPNKESSKESNKVEEKVDQEELKVFAEERIRYKRYLFFFAFFFLLFSFSLFFLFYFFWFVFEPFCSFIFCSSHPFFLIFQMECGSDFC